MAHEELEESIRRLKGPGPARVDVSPSSPFDALLEQRMRALENHVDELKGRVNGLVFLVVGAVIVQIVLGFVR